VGDVVLQELEKCYGDTTACANISLEIKEGEFFTFLGPSGCGKTTLLRLIAGFIQPDRGSIHIGARDITYLEPEQRKVGMVFQNYALFPFMTVGENIAYGLRIQRKSAAEIRKKREHYLAMVGLAGYQNRNISELSGGEQQRVALARSLAVEPQVLLLDEPLSNLDARLRDTMRKELKSLQKRLGITTLFVTHDQAEALTMSDKIAVFRKGACIQSGTPEEIYQYPRDSFVAEFVGDTNLFPVRFEDGAYMLANNRRVVGPDSTSGAYISVRPQSLAISSSPLEQDNCLAGVVEECQYNGLTSEYAVRVDDLLFRAVRLNSETPSDPYPVGSQVYVGFSRRHVQILDQ
jgi:iron(III) transport system ATP-binding protein